MPQCDTEIQYVHVEEQVPLIVTGSPMFFYANDGSLINLATIQQIYVYQGYKGYYWVYGRDMCKQSWLLSDGFPERHMAEAWLNQLMKKLVKEDAARQ